MSDCVADINIDPAQNELLVNGTVLIPYSYTGYQPLSSWR